MQAKRNRRMSSDWDLPDDWETATDAKGRIYYVNYETGQTQWNKPGEVKQAKQAAPRGVGLSGRLDRFGEWLDSVSRPLDHAFASLATGLHWHCNLYGRQARIHIGALPCPQAADKVTSTLLAPCLKR